MRRFFKVPLTTILLGSIAGLALYGASEVSAPVTAHAEVALKKGRVQLSLSALYLSLTPFR